VYSEVGEGTTIKIYLPRYLGDEAIARASTPPSVVNAGGGHETILVVEDHDDLRAYSSGVLRELGYNVLEAINGRAALDVLQAHDGVDLLFTDVVLPDRMDGRMLAEEAERRRPGIKVLYTTGYTRNAIVHNGRLDAGVDLLSKPFTYEALAAKVRRLLDRS
jgi:CheY-like chemotaxis protein